MGCWHFMQISETFHVTFHNIPTLLLHQNFALSESENSFGIDTFTLNFEHSFKIFLTTKRILQFQILQNIDSP